MYARPSRDRRVQREPKYSPEHPHRSVCSTRMNICRDRVRCSTQRQLCSPARMVVQLHTPKSISSWCCVWDPPVLRLGVVGRLCRKLLWFFSCPTAMLSYLTHKLRTQSLNESETYHVKVRYLRFLTRDSLPKDFRKFTWQCFRRLELEIFRKTLYTFRCSNWFSSFAEVMDILNMSVELFFESFVLWKYPDSD